MSVQRERESVMGASGGAVGVWGRGEPSRERLALVEHYVEVQEKKLCVCSWGTPGLPMVFLLHGLQSHAGLWDRIAPVIAARGYHVVAPDRRGHGRSDWFASYNMLDYVTDIRAVLDAIGSPVVTLVGHCESTLLVSLFAAAFPASVRKLVLLQFPDLSRRIGADTRAGLISLYLQKSGRAGTVEHPIFGNAEEALERLLKDAPFQVPVAMAAKVTPRNIKPVDGGFTWRWDPCILKFKLMFGLIDVDVFAETLKQVKPETRVVYGEHSSLVSNRDGKILEFARAMLPRCTPRLVAGGHYPHMEAELSDELIGAFV